ncbi:transposase [Vitiosangium sp. GDMCC 1.1324]|uniref:transposase n=1 Tax=Vitiosangium sp. (strain GDMCC 1.1324) TaxID=2138576 RepID=UPI001E61E760|nr:transposase [Vitiosangium sp. GDMCC 1.1324]
MDDALEWGVRPYVALADAGYGDCREFREELTRRGLPYVVGVQSTHKVWPPGVVPHRIETPQAREVAPAPVTWPKGAWSPGALRNWLLSYPRSNGTRRAGLRGVEAGSHPAPPPPACAQRRGVFITSLPVRRNGCCASGPRERRLQRSIGSLLYRRTLPNGPWCASKTALAGGARLPGNEAGGGARPFRGPHLARLPPPRHPLCCRPRLPRAPSSAFPPAQNAVDVASGA